MSIHSAALHVGSNQSTSTPYVGTTPGTSGGGDGGDGGRFNFNPSRKVNQTIGRNTNHSVPVWSLIRRFHTGAEKYIQRGQFAFIQSEGPRTFDTSKLTTMFNLPTLNYYLAKLSVLWASDPSKAITANYIADTYVPHGVVLSSNGEAGNRNEPRMVNATVRGEADTFNIWSEHMHDGDRLWFLYKRVSTLNLNEQLSGLDYSLDFDGSTLNVDTKPGSYIWQVVPFVERVGSQVNWLQELTVDGIVGVRRYVGRVQHCRKLRTGPIRATHLLRLHKMVQMPQCSVFIDL